MKNILLYPLFIFILCASTSYADSEINFYLGSAYIVNPLGEGEESKYAKNPLFREDGFDCTTYVETILAQHKTYNSSSNQSDEIFFRNLMSIRYVDGKIDFFSRAHFMEYHWIPNALKYNYISAYPIENSKQSKLKINLQKWFLDNQFIENKDKNYQIESKKQPAKINVSIPYIPCDSITKEFIESLPDFMLVFFLRKLPSHSLPGQSEEISLVTHMGILQNSDLYHASILTKKVTKQNFLEYLKKNSSLLGVSFYNIN